MPCFVFPTCLCSILKVFDDNRVISSTGLDSIKDLMDKVDGTADFGVENDHWKSELFFPIHMSSDILKIQTDIAA